MAITISGSGIVEANLADDAVTLAKMASGTDGEVITYDASGNPTTVSVGTTGHVLTSTGVGSAPTMQATAAGGKVLQVVTWTNSSYTSTSSSSYVDTGMHPLNITTTEANSKILIMFGMGYTLDTASQNSHGLVQLRTSLDSYSSLLTQALLGMRMENAYQDTPYTQHVLYSPNQSASTLIGFKTYFKLYSGSGLLYIGDNNPDSTDNTITAMEISA
jgi:hypothetical protein